MRKRTAVSPLRLILTALALGFFAPSLNLNVGNVEQPSLSGLFFDQKLSFSFVAVAEARGRRGGGGMRRSGGMSRSRGASRSFSRGPSSSRYYGGNYQQYKRPSTRPVNQRPSTRPSKRPSSGPSIQPVPKPPNRPGKPGAGNPNRPGKPGIRPPGNRPGKPGVRPPGHRPGAGRPPHGRPPHGRPPHHRPPHGVHPRPPHGGGWYYRSGWYWPVGAAAFGAATGFALGTIVATLPSDCVTVYEGDIAYRECDGIYYEPFYEGGILKYRVVAAP